MSLYVSRSVIQYNTVMSMAILVPLVLLSGELNDIFSTVYFWDEFGFWSQLVRRLNIGEDIHIDFFCVCVNRLLLL
jgi:hypothetical protein